MNMHRQTRKQFPLNFPFGLIAVCIWMLFFTSVADCAGNEIDANLQWARQVFSEQAGTEPFSFVYNGQSSRSFLNSWQRQVQEQGIDENRLQRTLTLTDSITALEVKAVVTIYTDTPGVDWTLYFTNNGQTDTPIIEQVQALDMSLELGSGKAPVLHRIHGSRNGMDDWHPFSESVSIGKRIEFGATGALSSYEIAPFFNLDWASGGVITAIGWTGNWGSSIAYNENQELHWNAGMRNIHLKLHPGETIRTPRIMQLYWLGSDELRSYNLFRRTMLNHIVPKINGETIVPPIVHMGTSFYELNSSSEENVLSHVESIKGLGFEYFWMDAYWMRGDVDHEAGPSFPNGIGNYGFPIERVPSSGFPRGLKPIGDRVHKDNMGFVVWFGPEIVYPNTYLAREHPEWVISPTANGSGTFNLGIPEAREYMTRYMNTVIKEYGIDCWRTDSGPQLVHWEFNDAQIGPDRGGITEIRHVEGYYQMWDDMRKANPHLFIDDCCGGGQRIDLETMSRAIPLWRTDGTIAPLFANDFNQAAMLNQIMTAGLNRYVPFSTSGMMGATPYWFRSGVNGGGISFAEDVRSLDYNRDAARKGMKEYNSAPQDRTEEYPRDLLKKGIAEAKRIRKYYFGNYYPLTPASASPQDWCVMQYHRLAEQDGMIVAFRRHESPAASLPCTLFEIDPQTRYEITKYVTYDPSEPVAITGKEFQNSTLIIEECPGSLIIEYQKIKP